MKVPHCPVLVVAVFVALSSSLPAQVLIDTDFNLPGSSAINEGSWKPVALRSADNQPANLQTEDGGGVSGKVGDRAFDNRKTTPSAEGRPLGGRGTMSKQTLSAPAVTISGWFRREAAPEGRGRQTLFIFQSGPGRDLQLESRQTDGKLQITVNGQRAQSGPLLGAEGEWVFLAVVYDSTTPEGHVKFFKGGLGSPVTEAATANLAAGPLDIRDGIPVVGNVGGRTAPFVGLIDDFRLEAAALDAEALENLKAASLASVSGQATDQ